MLDFDDELDYEEEDLQNDEVVKKSSAEDENVTECDDQYLRIDVSEGEENFANEEPLKSDKVEKRICAEGVKDSEKSNERKKKCSTQTFTSGKANENHNSKKKKTLRPAKCGSELQKTKGKIHEAKDTKEQAACVQCNNNNRTGECGVKSLRGGILGEDEKEVVKLKKEARLRRFMNDQIKITQERKITNSGLEKGSDKNVVVGGENCQKEKGVRVAFGEGPLEAGLQQNQNKKSNNNAGYVFPHGKPAINKELLLRKRNPFDENYTSAKVVEENEKEAECELLTSTEGNRRLTRRTDGNALRTSLTAGRNFYVVKSDVDSCVKFVRAVPKAFGDLPLKNQNRPSGELPKDDEESAPSHIFKTSFQEGHIFCGSEKDFAQTGSLLIGNIVKVLNIPPSTTAKEVLTLCKKIGPVVEIKLNFPKENSVVIRFAEPVAAEKFFNVYHGQKFNNYFLNVIVV